MTIRSGPGSGILVAGDKSHCSIPANNEIGGIVLGERMKLSVALKAAVLGCLALASISFAVAQPAVNGPETPPTPTPTSTPTATATPTATNTATYTPTAAATVTPIPPPPEDPPTIRQCAYGFAAYATYRNITGYNAPIIFSGNAPSCIHAIYQRCGSNGLTETFGPQDECVLSALLGRDFNALYTQWANSLPPAQAIWLFYSGYSGRPLIGESFVGDDCSVHPTNNLPPNFEVCGQFAGQAGQPTITPISFIWDPAVDIHRSATSVEFPLSSRDKNARYFLWKASAAAPLLVYDPKHEGKITSAAQLFGGEAFGRDWKSGYDALRSLDTNGDKILTGTELKPLALWFDGNRNGVSEDGEVRSLSREQVMTVFYAKATVDKDSGELGLKVGFQRMVDGELKDGSSVDWHSASSPSKLDPPARGSTKSVTGLWKWKMLPGTLTPNRDEDMLPAEGLLSLTDGGPELIFGYSFVENAILSAHPELKRRIAYYGIRGSKNQGASGVDLNLTVNHGTISPGQTVSTAVLSEDGNQLIGKSRVLKPSGTLIARYDWVAERQ